MDTRTFEARIEETRQRIERLPEDQRFEVIQLLDETERRHAQIQGHMDRLRGLLSDWRVKIKYLRFDLEATKRELADLRRNQEGGSNQT